VGEEMTRGCVLTTFLYDGRLHREKKDCERKKEKCMFPIIITCGPPQREEIFFLEKF